MSECKVLSTPGAEGTALDTCPLSFFFSLCLINNLPSGDPSSLFVWEMIAGYFIKRCYDKEEFDIDCFGGV